MKLIKLVECESALSKLFTYEYLPARSVYYLSTARIKANDILESYHLARNSLLIKYGKTDDCVSYRVTGSDNIQKYRAELNQLGNQDIEDLFPKEKIVLCVQHIEESDKQIPPEKRLGFSAKDWAAIQEVIKVVETEE